MILRRHSLSCTKENVRPKLHIAQKYRLFIDCCNERCKLEKKHYFLPAGPERLQTEDEEEDCLKKRHRTSFTSFQLKRLEDEFERESYIVGMKRWKLSEELEIPEKQIKIWFQNKRTKVKKLR